MGKHRNPTLTTSEFSRDVHHTRDRAGTWFAIKKESMGYDSDMTQILTIRARVPAKQLTSIGWTRCDLSEDACYAIHSDGANRAQPHTLAVLDTSRFYVQYLSDRNCRNVPSAHRLVLQLRLLKHVDVVATPIYAVVTGRPALFENTHLARRAWVEPRCASPRGHLWPPTKINLTQPIFGAYARQSRP